MARGEAARLKTRLAGVVAEESSAAPAEEVPEPDPPTIVVFTTREVAPKVERIDDAKLAELLTGGGTG